MIFYPVVPKFGNGNATSPKVVSSWQQRAKGVMLAVMAAFLAGLPGMTVAENVISDARYSKSSVRYPDVVWKSVCGYSYYIVSLFEESTGNAVMAPDNQPEPFIGILRDCDGSKLSYIGLYSDRTVIEIESDGDPLLYGRRRYMLQSDGRILRSRKWIPMTKGQLDRSPPLEVRRRESVPLRLGCSNDSTYYSGPLVRVELGIISSSREIIWRKIYLAIHPELSRDDDYLQDVRLSDDALISSDLGDGTMMVTLEHSRREGAIIFRIDSRSGMPIGPLPEWIRVVDYSDAIDILREFMDRRKMSLPAICPTDEVLFAYEDFIINKLKSSSGAIVQYSK